MFWLILIAICALFGAANGSIFFRPQVERKIPVRLIGVIASMAGFGGFLVAKGFGIAESILIPPIFLGQASLWAMGLGACCILVISLMTRLPQSPLLVFSGIAIGIAVTQPVHLDLQGLMDFAFTNLAVTFAIAAGTGVVWNSILTFWGELLPHRVRPLTTAQGVPIDRRDNPLAMQYALLAEDRSFENTETSGESVVRVSRKSSGILDGAGFLLHAGQSAVFFLILDALVRTTAGFSTTYEVLILLAFAVVTALGIWFGGQKHSFPIPWLALDQRAVAASKVLPVAVISGIVLIGTGMTPMLIVFWAGLLAGLSIRLEFLFVNRNPASDVKQTDRWHFDYSRVMLPKLVGLLCSWVTFPLMAGAVTTALYFAFRGLGGT